MSAATIYPPYVSAMQALIGELSSLGYNYLSTNSGMGFSETWWQHPSGASVNLDDSISIESNRRRVADAKSSIIRHEFKAKVQAKADAVAKVRRRDMKAVIGYYLGVGRLDRKRLDWHVRYEIQGNSYGYSSGQELLPETYAEIAEHFPRPGAGSEEVVMSSPLDPFSPARRSLKGGF